MSTLFYVTHPQVQLDPTRAVTNWSLNELGRERARVLSTRSWLCKVRRLISSDETKAMETANILASALGLAVEIREGIGENDRSSTGFVPPAEFEGLADAFFARPEESVRGWERAIDAQRRIARGLGDLLGVESASEPDVVVVGHGGVGTLWYCHLARVPVGREHDQPGQGHFFAVDRVRSAPLHGWRSIDMA